jgi:protein-L-isoaspartate(D-aspartate) O-methyltransferase
MTAAGRGRGNFSETDAARFSEERALMVAQQLRAREIRDARVLDAMLDIPRHIFVPAGAAAQAYGDQPLPIGEDQTISQPYMVAVMSEALELSGSERVLEIGTGSGYQTAVLARLAREVFSVEVNAALAALARERLALLGFSNAVVLTADGSAGLADHAPYDAILVTAAAPAIPPPLLEQLAEGGRLVIPIGRVGAAETQELIRVRKHAGQSRQEVLHYCRFVPLVGRYGWQERDA